MVRDNISYVHIWTIIINSLSIYHSPKWKSIDTIHNHSLLANEKFHIWTKTPQQLSSVYQSTEINKVFFFTSVHCTASTIIFIFLNVTLLYICSKWQHWDDKLLLGRIENRFGCQKINWMLKLTGIVYFLFPRF